MNTLSQHINFSVHYCVVSSDYRLSGSAGAGNATPTGGYRGGSASSMNTPMGGGGGLSTPASVASASVADQQTPTTHELDETPVSSMVHEFLESNSFITPCVRFCSLILLCIVSQPLSMFPFPTLLCIVHVNLFTHALHIYACFVVALFSPIRSARCALHSTSHQTVEELRAAVAAAQRQRRSVAAEKARVLSASASVASMREQV